MENFRYLLHLVEICGKTFTIVLFMQYLLTSLMKYLPENFHGSYVANLQKPRKFSTVNNLHYMVLPLSIGSKCLKAWGLRSKTWGLSDLDPNLIANQIRVAIDGFNYRAGHYKNYHVPKIGCHFVGQKRNKVSRVSLTIQYLNQVFDNKEQLINIDIV